MPLWNITIPVLERELRNGETKVDQPMVTQSLYGRERDETEISWIAAQCFKPQPILPSQSNMLIFQNVEISMEKNIKQELVRSWKKRMVLRIHMDRRVGEVTPHHGATLIYPGQTGSNICLTKILWLIPLLAKFVLNAESWDSVRGGNPGDYKTTCCNFCDRFRGSNHRRKWSCLSWKGVACKGKQMQRCQKALLELTNANPKEMKGQLLSWG